MDEHDQAVRAELRSKIRMVWTNGVRLSVFPYLMNCALRDRGNESWIRKQPGGIKSWNLSGAGLPDGSNDVFLAEFEFFEVDQRKVFADQFFVKLVRLVHLIQQTAPSFQQFEINCFILRQRISFLFLKLTIERSQITLQFREQVPQMLVLRSLATVLLRQEL